MKLRDPSAHGASMSNAQKLALRLSEIRQKLNELSGKDELSEAEQTEMRSLTAEFPAVEERWRGATVAERTEEAAARGADPDSPGAGEAAEVRRLREAVRLSDYLTPAAAGAGLLGAAAEFNAALELPAVGASGGVAVPWDVLLTPERRAFTSTRIHDHHELRGAASGNGRSCNGCSARTSWGLLACASTPYRPGGPNGRYSPAGCAPAQKAEGTAADTPAAATFATEVLKPKRLTGCTNTPTNRRRRLSSWKPRYGGTWRMRYARKCPTWR